MGKRVNKRRKAFKRKVIEIPQTKSGIETLNNPCDICGGHVIYTDNKILYKESKGLGVCYYCEDCHASVMCNKSKKEYLPDGTQIYAPLGIIADKESRQLRLRCHQILDSKWRIQRTMKRSTAYHKLAKGMGIPFENCHFAWMNEEQLSYALEVLTMTEWTRNRFD